ncbi:MAG: cupin domain-containing protein [Gemmatimonadetes bacterium]|nr:cupin domain-containing protein [Gemmatimonadota bacterium]
MGRAVHPEAAALIAHFGMVPLPAEGTLFVSTYRSPTEFADGSPHGTAIIAMYCDDPPSQSLFHRLPVDEVWHFYGGDPLRLVLLHPDGSSEDVIMGANPLAGEHVQVVVPAGSWQAGHLVAGGRYALFGCTMAPGFTGAMYEGGERDVLRRRYPDRADDIERLGCAAQEARMPEGFAP